MRKTLKSIYSHDNLKRLEEFEVIVSDNDPEKKLQVLISGFRYSNFHYKTSSCAGFENSLFALSYGSGHLLKLHNNTMIFEDGVITEMIHFVSNNLNSKPLIFYSNGNLRKFSERKIKSFDMFIKELSFYSSWSNGFTIWKDDFNEKLMVDEYFPQVSLLFDQYNKKSFYICDKKYFKGQRVKNKGGYNIFEVFCFNYFSLLRSGVKNKRFSEEAVIAIKKEMLLEFFPRTFFKNRILRIENFQTQGLKTALDSIYPWYGYYFVVIFGTLYFFTYSIEKVKILISKILPTSSS